MEVYAAGEEPIPGADSKSLCRSIRQRSTKQEPVYIASDDELEETLMSLLKEDDLVITQGAGNVGMIAPRLAASLIQQGEESER